MVSNALPKTISSDPRQWVPLRWIWHWTSRVFVFCSVLHEEITLGVDGSQQILSPRYSTGSYISNSNAIWVIHSQPGRKLLINFDTFSTELDFDIFSVGDGGTPNDLSTLFFVWSGKLMPPVVVSNSNHMWISFESDGTIDTGGFDFTVFDVDNTGKFQDCPKGIIVLCRDLGNFFRVFLRLGAQFHRAA